MLVPKSIRVGAPLPRLSLSSPRPPERSSVPSSLQAAWETLQLMADTKHVSARRAPPPLPGTRHAPLMCPALLSVSKEDPWERKPFRPAPRPSERPTPPNEPRILLPRCPPSYTASTPVVARSAAATEMSQAAQTPLLSDGGGMQAEASHEDGEAHHPPPP